MNSVVMPMRPRGIEGEEVDVRSCRRGDGVPDGAADVGRRVHAVDLAHRHFQALAEQQHGLAPAPDAGEEFAEVAERVEHRERPLLALEIEHADRRRRVGDAGTGIDFVVLPIEPGELAVVVLLERFDGRRLQAAADELVDGGDQQIAIVREVLRGIGAAAGIDDGREIVGAEMPIDELARRLLDDGRAERADVDIVQHQHVHAAVERPCIRARVGGDRTTEHGESIRTLDRQLDVRKHLDLLRLAVLEDLEVVARQAGDEVAVLIGDDRIDVDVVHLDLKRHRWGSLGRLGGA